MMLLQKTNRTLEARHDDLRPTAVGRGAVHKGFIRTLSAHSAALATFGGPCLILLLAFLNRRFMPGMRYDVVYLVITIFSAWVSVGARIAPVIVATVIAIGANSPGLFSGPAYVSLWVEFILKILVTCLAAWLTAGLGLEHRGLSRQLSERSNRLENLQAEQRQTAHWLEEALHLLEGLGDNVRSVLWVTDPLRRKFEFVNAAFEKLWGEAPERLYESPGTWMRRVHPEDRERVAQAFVTWQCRGEFEEQYRLLHADGTVRWVHDRAFPIKDNTGAVYRVLGITEDITARKTAEQMLALERDIALALSATNDLQTAIDGLLQIASHMEGIDCCAVYLVEAETGILQLSGHRGLSEPCVARVLSYSASSREARLCRSARTVCVREDQIPRNETTFWGEEGLKALIITPLRLDGAPVGLLYAGSYHCCEMAEGTRTAVEMLSPQLAGAIARFRLQREVLEIADGEQARLGQELHDGLCQQLIGTAFKAQMLERTLRGAQSSHVELAGRICELLDEAITESRRVCRGLYPVRLSTDGLVPALIELAASVSQRHGIECRCESSSAADYELATATHIYRIAQEAVNNAVKHSGAKTISILLTGDATGSLLCIADDGAGFDPTAATSSGMGLHIMQYRARLLGSELKIARQSPRGTQVSVFLPAKLGLL